jgi:uncharacterized membrane protein
MEEGDEMRQIVGLIVILMVFVVCNTFSSLLAHTLQDIEVNMDFRRIGLM